MKNKVNTYTKKQLKLTDEQTIDLFKQLAASQEAKRILDSADPNDISKEYSDKLNSKILAGNNAKEKLFEANIGLVSMRVPKFLTSAHHLTYDDLFQEASLGLVVAIERFEIEKNNKLSTYAMIWIDRYMLNAIKNMDRPIRYPKHVEEKLSKINHAEGILLQRGIINPTPNDISKLCGLTAKEVKTILMNKSEVFSLNTKVSDKDDTTFEDMVSDDDKTPLDKRLYKDRNKALIDQVNNLPAKEALIIKMRFGLDGYPADITLEEIGLAVGLSKEAVRQSVVRSLNILRGNQELLAACF